MLKGGIWFPSSVFLCLHNLLERDNWLVEEVHRMQKALGGLNTDHGCHLHSTSIVSTWFIIHSLSFNVQRINSQYQNYFTGWLLVWLQITWLINVERFVIDGLSMYIIYFFCFPTQNRGIYEENKINMLPSVCNPMPIHEAKSRFTSNI